mmetsp:Transcript_18150/g.59603  ORF Transcript_18150/g.59603 Transcript_18150/m.59603 type:complete len:383 (+) Transcript_18150:486-1634(+)
MPDEDHAWDAVGVSEEEAQDELVVLLLISCLVHHLVEQVPDRHTVRLQVARVPHSIVGCQRLSGVEGHNHSPQVQLLLLLLLREPPRHQRLQHQLSCSVHASEVREGLEGEEDELEVMLRPQSLPHEFTARHPVLLHRSYELLVLLLFSSLALLACNPPFLCTRALGIRGRGSSSRSKGLFRRRRRRGESCNRRLSGEGSGGSGRVERRRRRRRIKSRGGGNSACWRGRRRRRRIFEDSLLSSELRRLFASRRVELASQDRLLRLRLVGLVGFRQRLRISCSALLCFPGRPLVRDDLGQQVVIFLPQSSSRSGLGHRKHRRHHLHELFVLLHVKLQLGPLEQEAIVVATRLQLGRRLRPCLLPRPVPWLLACLYLAPFQQSH